MYGGEDIEWIRRFISIVKEVAIVVGIELELVYVGKSNVKERVRKIIVIIDKEKLSYFWFDIILVWYFWIRLECMFYLKM